MKYTRATGIGALALISFAVFGAVSAASAAPNPPSILVPSDGFATTDGLVSLSGTAELSSTVTVSLDGQEIAACTDMAVVDNVTEGLWSCPDVPIAVGDNVFTAVTTVASESSPPSSPVTVVRGGSEAVDIADLSDTADTTPAFSGTGPALGTVEVHNADEGDELLCTASVNLDTTWFCDSSELAYGSYSVTAYGFTVDSVGWLSQDTTGPFTLTPAKPLVQYGFGPSSVAITISGAPGSTVATEVYSVEVVQGEGEGYQYGQIVGGCPSFSEEGANPGFTPQSCTFSALATGIWNFYSWQVADSVLSEYRNDFVRIPDVPTMTAQAISGQRVTASGTGTPGDLARVINPSGTTACQTAVGANSLWSCTFSASAGSHSYRAVQVSNGFVAEPPPWDPADNSYDGISAATSPSTVSVSAPPSTAQSTDPTPLDWDLDIIGDDDGTLTPNETITLAGSGLPPGSGVLAELHSTPVELGTTTVDPDGTFSMVVQIPADTPPGDHNIVVIVTAPSGSSVAPSTAEEPVTVVSDAQTLSDEAAPTGAGAPGIRQQPGAPSALSDGFATPLEVLSNPLVVATAGSFGLAFVLAVLVPAEFFGETLAHQYSALANFFGRRRRLTRVVEGIGSWVSTHRAISAVALVLLTSAVFCLVDPGFGFDLTSLRLLLSCAITILLVNFASAGITEFVAERAWQVPTRLKVMPWGLLIAGIGVVVSRLLDFSPGFLIGSIIGVSVIGSVGAKLETRVILLWSSVVWGIAVAAWACIGLVPSLPAGDPASFFTGLLSDSLVATSSAGLTALLVALLPIALFDGGELFAHSKLRWAIAFGIAVFSFCVVVVPGSGNWLDLGSGLSTWLLCTLIFVALAIAAYIFARTRSRSEGSTRSRLLSAG